MTLLFLLVPTVWKCVLILSVSLQRMSASQSAAHCKDVLCFCTAIGGKWIATPTTVRPTCRKTVSHKGVPRIVDVYFPQGIQAAGTSYTPWVFLHGVHTAKWHISDYPYWQQLSKSWPVPLGGNAQADQLGVLTGSAITSGLSSSAGNGSGLVKDGNYILVVPEATGSPDSGQMWNSLFWPCMAAIPKCIGKDVDDVGFIAQLLNNMQQLLPGVPLQPRSVLSGYSNGGMLAQALLCKRPDIANKLVSVGIIASTLGEKFAAEDCQSQLPRALPLVWVHGTADDTLPYDKGLSEGVPVLGAAGAVALWAARMGCPAAAIVNPVVIHTDVGRAVVCKDYCSQPQKQQQKQQQQTKPDAVVLCTASGQPHQLVRTLPGYPAALVRWAAPAPSSGRAFEGSPTPF